MIPPAARPPAGFTLFAGRGPFTTHNGPIYRGEIEDGVCQGFYALARHCNGMGLIHGGMISAFFDGLLAGAAARGAGLTPITVQLSIYFLGVGREGDWVVGHARATRRTRDIVFVEGHIFVDDRDLARASAVFKLTEPKG